MALHTNFKNGFLLNLVKDEKFWNSLAPEEQAQVVLSHRNTTYVTAYAKVTGNPEALGHAILDNPGADSKANVCSAAAVFELSFYEVLPQRLLAEFLDKLAALKSGKKALETLKANKSLMEKAQP